MLSKVKIIPIVGVASAGKSTFYNSLLQIGDLVDARDEVTTKFALLFMHNPERKSPTLIHLKVVQAGSGYRFEKDPHFNEVSDFNEIKRIIKEENDRKLLKYGVSSVEMESDEDVVEKVIELLERHRYANSH